MWTVEGIDDENKPQIDKSDFSVVIAGERVIFDVALIMVHGVPGENGLLQSYLEMMHIPFTTCSAAVSMYTFEKFVAKSMLKNSNVKMAKEVRLQKGAFYALNAEAKEARLDQVIEKLGLPIFVKPNAEGSSYGVSKVTKKEELLPAFETAFQFGKEILAEEFIDGRELTNGFMRVVRRDGSTKDFVLPVTEIVPDKTQEFFDFNAKYNGFSQEITPAPIDDELKVKIQKTSSYIYDYLGCNGVIRIDYMATADGELYFLEVNSVPGMTKGSLVPQQLAYAGYTMGEFLDAMVEDALIRAGK